MKNITAAELKQALKEGSEKILIVDVRETICDQFTDAPNYIGGIVTYGLEGICNGEYV